MKIKKMLCLLVAVIIILSLYGCHHIEEENTIKIPAFTQIAPISDIAEEPTIGTTNATEEIKAAVEETAEPTIETMPQDISTAPEPEKAESVKEMQTAAVVAAKSVHTHQWQDTVRKPTCTEQGHTTHTCITCSDSYTDSYVSSAGHNWGQWKKDIGSNEEKRSCSECTATEKRTVNQQTATHEHSYISNITKTATCSTYGETTYTCDCGNSYTSQIQKAEHKYCAVVVSPKCTENGYTFYDCKYCDAAYHDSITDATGHAWGNWSVAETATKISTGTKIRYCFNCNCTETAPIDKLTHAHSYTAKITTAAGCDTDGIRTYTCSCGDSYTQTLFATGHTWSHWKYITEPSEKNTGIKERTCASCQKTETQILPKVEHTHSMVHIRKKPTCTDGGYTTHKCSMCDYSYIDTHVSANGHTWSDWNTVIAPTTTSAGRAERFCSSCYAVDTKNLDKIFETHTHSYVTILESVAATCESDGYIKKACSCGDMITETISTSGHSWTHHHTDETGRYVPRIVCHCGWSCSADGDYISSYAAHVDSLSEDEKWTHSYYEGREWVVDTPAKDWESCSICGVEKY